MTDWKMIMFEGVAGRRFNKSMTPLKDIHK